MNNNSNRFLKSILHTKIMPALCALLIAPLFIGCGGKKKAAPGSDIPVFAVNTSTAAQGQVWDYIALSGDIIAGSTVDVFSDVAGRVTEVFVGLGSRVSRGSPIVAVDPSRAGMNFMPGISYATIDGTVIALPAQLGATVSQAIPVARISGSGALEIKLYVAERFISKIALDQLCEITLDAWPGETFRGTVTEISPVIDPASRTMEVNVNVTNQDDKLKQGMFAKVKLITEQKENTVKIPSSALIQRFGESYVFVVEEAPPEALEEGETGRILVAKKRVVQPGILIDGILEITSGLRNGEEFIVKGQTLLNEGARINIIEKTPPLGRDR